MSKVLVNETSLTSIANAIRAKNGETTTYKPAQMATAITNLPTGGDTIAPFTLTGNCANLFESGKLVWLLNDYSDIITTENITNLAYMFSNCGLETIPIDLNMKDINSYTSLQGLFYNTKELKNLPVMNWGRTYTTNLDIRQIFDGCWLLREIPDTFCFHTYYTLKASQAFRNCHSLRSVENVFKYRQTLNTVGNGGDFYQEMFSGCYVLDKVENIPVAYSTNAPTFTDMFKNCFRLQDVTFECKADGTPYTAGWKSAYLDLKGIGHQIHDSLNGDDITKDYNSGITADKEVTDATSYEALKNDPDWYTRRVHFSRYNKQSAIKTINSLPDCSSGGMNIINFTGGAGSLSGGAIQNLTEEQIAVATAKGFTVSFV